MANNQLVNNLKELSELTNNGKVFWKRENPTTVFFERTNPNAIVTIQKLPNYTYLFNIIDKTTRNTLLSINSNTEYSYKQLLEQLFAIAQTTIDKRGLDFFNEILKGD